MRILHVDDEAEFTELVTFFLGRQGDFEVEAAESAEEALKLLGSRKFDAMVVDYTLPGMDGIELLKIIRAQGNRIPIILFTGKGREDTAAQALNNGADFYLEKGTNPQAHFAELANMLTQSISARRMDEDIARSERFLSDVFSSIQDGVSILDKNLSILRVNATMERWYAHKSPLVGKKCFDAYHGRGAHCDVCPSLRTIETGKAAMEVVPKVGAGGISTGWLEVYSFPMIESGSGELTGVIEYVRDITERRKADLKLDAVLRRYRELGAIIDKSPTILVQWTSEPGAPVSYISDGIARWGYKREDFTSTLVYDDIIHKDDLELNRKEFKEYAASGRDDFVQEYRVVTKSGETRWVEDHTYVRKRTEGKPTEYDAVVIDITARKLAQQKSEELASRLQAIVDAFPDLYLRASSDGTILDVSASHSGAVYSFHKELVGRKIQEVLPPPIGSKYEEAMRDILSTGKATSIEYFLGSGGERHAFEARLMPFQAQNLLIVVRDITGRVLAEEALRTSEEKYRKLVELAREGIILTDKNSSIVLANPRMSEMLGRSTGELVGRPVFQFLDESSVRVAKSKLEEGKKGVSDSYDATFVKKDGALLHANIGVTPVLDEEGRYSGSLAVVSDISERLKYEMALEAANAKLNLLGHVTRHDAMNQLAVLVGWLEIAREVTTDKSIQEHLKNMGIAADTIQKQLDFAGDYQRMGVSKPRWIKLDEAFSSGIAGLKTEGVKMSSDLKGIEVFADPMLERVFHNLVDNSLRHGERVTSIRLGVVKRNEHLVIIYEDNGVGVPESEKSVLFERGRGKHTGFGLFMVREILSITGITIAEKGRRGEGARFEFTVPAGGHRTAA